MCIKIINLVSLLTYVAFKAVFFVKMSTLQTQRQKIDEKHCPHEIRYDKKIIMKVLEKMLHISPFVTFAKFV